MFLIYNKSCIFKISWVHYICKSQQLNWRRLIFNFQLYQPTMDPDQFRQFMTAFQEQQMALITQLFTQLSPEKKHDSSNNYKNIVPFENFNPKIEKFSSYLERFENYYTMKEVKDENKIAQLLCASIGSTHFSNLAAFLGPEKPVGSLAYDVLIDSFKQMLIPRKNVVVSQHYFLNVFQKDGQSISDFVATLQRDKKTIKILNLPGY